jgi:hypothetical protein
LKVLGFDPQRAAYLQQHDDGGPGDLLRQLDGVSDAKLTELDDTLKAARGAVKRKTMGAEVFEKKVRESYREAMGEKKDGDTPIVGEEEYVSRAKESLEPKEGK